jgi:erythronate-4-phosphate dehydrogenase
MKLIIDDACYAYEKIFGDFGNITPMAGRDINADSVKNADVLIVRSRTRVDEIVIGWFSSKNLYGGSALRPRWPPQPNLT